VERFQPGDVVFAKFIRNYLVAIPIPNESSGRLVTDYKVKKAKSSVETKEPIEVK